MKHLVSAYLVAKLAYRIARQEDGIACVVQGVMQQEWVVVVWWWWVVGVDDGALFRGGNLAPVKFAA